MLKTRVSSKFIVSRDMTEKAFELFKKKVFDTGTCIIILLNVCIGILGIVEFNHFSYSNSKYIYLILTIICAILIFSIIVKFIADRKEMKEKYLLLEGENFNCDISDRFIEISSEANSKDEDDSDNDDDDDDYFPMFEPVAIPLNGDFKIISSSDFYVVCNTENFFVINKSPFGDKKQALDEFLSSKLLDKFVEV